MSVALDDVCTEEQLNEYLGGQLTAQTLVLPKGWATAEPARQFALDRVLDALKRKKPPIREADIADPTELRVAVQYGAAARIYWLAVSSGGDAELWMVKYAGEKKLFDAEVGNLQITGPEGVNIVSNGFRVSRG